MGTFSIIVMCIFFILALFIIAVRTVNHIPKRGRSNEANGDKIEATIINENRSADKPATMKLVDEDGNKYRVKMKHDEARMWIKGDKAEVLLSEKKGKYRVLFNDYFHANESRIRDYAAEKIKKSAKTWFISSRFAGCTEKSLEGLINSKADSRVLFIFMTYMRMINTYSIVALVVVSLFLGWRSAYSPSFSEQSLPLFVLLMTCLAIYNSTMVCKKILKQYAQQ